MTVLVIGGNGLIGSGLVGRLAQMGHGVISYGYNRPERVVAGCTYYTGDVGEYGTLDRIFRAHPVDVVIHNAAISSPGAFVENPFKIYRVNVGGLLTSLEAASQNGVKRFVYISSDAVYGEDSSGVITEESPLHLTEAYGASKAACESIITNYGGIQTAALRVGTVFGPHRKFNCPINQLINEALEKNQAVWYCGEDQQDFIYEDDAVEGIIAVALARKWNHRVYNLGGGHARPFGEVVLQLQKLLPECTFRRADSYQPLGFGAELCSSRAEEEFGWKQQVTFEEGLHRCVLALKKERGGVCV